MKKGTRFMRKKRVWRLLLLLMAIMAVAFVKPQDRVSAAEESDEDIIIDGDDDYDRYSGDWDYYDEGDEEFDDPDQYPPYMAGTTNKATEIECGKSYFVSNIKASNEPTRRSWFEYTPKQDERVCIEISTNNEYAGLRALLRDSKGLYIASTGTKKYNDDDEYSTRKSARMTLTLSAGKKYYIQTGRLKSGEEEGNYTLTLRGVQGIKDIAYITPRKTQFLAQLDNTYLYKGTMQIIYEDDSTETVTFDQDTYSNTEYTDIYGNKIYLHIKGIDEDNSNIDIDVDRFCELDEGNYRIYAVWGNDGSHSVDGDEISIVSASTLPDVGLNSFSVKGDKGRVAYSWHRFVAPETTKYTINNCMDVCVYEAASDGSVTYISGKDSFNAVAGKTYYIGLSGNFSEYDKENSEFIAYDTWESQLTKTPGIKTIKNIVPTRTTFIAGFDSVLTRGTKAVIEYTDGSTENVTFEGDYDDDVYCVTEVGNVKIYAEVDGDIDQPGTYNVIFKTDSEIIEGVSYSVTLKNISDMELPELKVGRLIIDTESMDEHQRVWYRFNATESGTYIFSKMTSFYDGMVVYKETAGDVELVESSKGKFIGEKGCTYYIGIYGNCYDDVEDQESDRWETDFYMPLDVTGIKISSSLKTVFAENIESNFLNGAVIDVTLSNGSIERYTMGEYFSPNCTWNNIYVKASDSDEEYGLYDAVPAGTYEVYFDMKDGRTITASNSTFTVKSVTDMGLQSIGNGQNPLNIYMGYGPYGYYYENEYWSDLYTYTAERDGRCALESYFSNNGESVYVDAAEVYEKTANGIEKIAYWDVDSEDDVEYGESTRYVFDVEKGHTYYVRVGKNVWYSSDYTVGMCTGKISVEPLKIVNHFSVTENKKFESGYKGDYVQGKCYYEFDDGTSGSMQYSFGENCREVMVEGNRFYYTITDINGNDRSTDTSLPDGRYTVRIRCQTADEEHIISVSYTIRIGDVVPVTAITLDMSEIDGMVNDVFTVRESVTPVNASDPSVTWSSSDEGVAIADDDGRVFCVGAGTATITATANDGSGVSTSIKATVRRRTARFNKVAQINKKVGDKTFALGAELLEGDGALSYKSSNTNVVIVDRDGKVTVRGAGTATITVTSAQTRSYEKATMNVTVKVQKPDPVDLSAKSAKTTVSGIVDGKYTGNGVTQSKLTVKAGGKTLTKDKDYRVAYKNNKNVGKATITITGIGSYKGTVTRSFNITISKGSTYTVGKLKYKVTNAATNGKGTVTVTGTTYKTGYKSFKTLDIKKTVSIGGVTYKVTAVGRNAFKGYKYITKATIGANVQTIGAGAFSGCSGLKSITISTAKLTSKSVGANAFARIYAKANVKVPAKQLTAYKKLLKQKGLPAKATVKK